MGYDVAFNSWNFLTQGAVVETVSISHNEGATAAKAARADAGISPEATMGALEISLVGTIVGTSITDLRDRWKALLKNTRGTDRIKRGKLSLYGDSRHFWAQRIGQSISDSGRGENNATFALRFVVDDPFQRNDSVSSKIVTPSAISPTATITFATDFNGDAYRIPIVLSCSFAWAKNDLFRLRNTTVGWTFEKRIRSASSSLGITIDGEAYECLEGADLDGTGISGTFPYLKGGVSNVLDFTDCSKFGSWTITFLDRWIG